jgi:hypothetical protein
MATDYQLFRHNQNQIFNKQGQEAIMNKQRSLTKIVWNFNKEAS